MTPFQGLSAFTITPTDARSRGRVVMVDGALADLGHVPVMGLGDRRCVHRLGDCIRHRQVNRRVTGSRHHEE
jgi:hypothetical protein